LNCRSSDQRFQVVLQATRDTVYDREIASDAMWWSGNGLAQFLERFFGLCLHEQFCRVFYERLVKRHGDDRAQS